MRYTELKPAQPLDAFVECIWFINGDRTDISEERIVPDGCMELVVHLADPFLQCSGKNETLQPGAFLVGGLTRRITLRPSGRVDTMGVRFISGRARPFFPVPAHELTDQFVSADALWGTSGRRLVERLQEVRGYAGRASVISAWLMRRLSTSVVPDARVCDAVDTIVRRAGRVDVTRLAGRAGMSRRQMERCFLSHVGLQPKTYSRIVRFQNVLRSIDGTSAWASVAVDCGYYDQAHLIRDFREFAGSPPSVFLKSEGDLSRVMHA